ncbi:MAG: class I SAM-dependent methyltransferase, partial [Candidatus Pacearchaeota archaeon]|nr:class I SAM-dependent methyltransferase [Candidatus Pacearchaeota archaeon]
MIIIKKEKESLILKRHPWLYSKAIHTIVGNPENGDIVPVCSRDNKVLCYGFYSPGSLISIRIISFGENKPEKEWLKIRIKNAYDLRKSLLIPSNGYRLINAEGDFLPGLIVDIYNKTTVIRPLIKGIENNLNTIIDILVELYPKNSIFIKRDEFSARKEDITIKNGFIRNNRDGMEIIEENGIHFYVDILSGQKTGFYFDLRDARILASTCCMDKRVLNLFSYTGAFALHAAKGRAKIVVSVEQSKKAIEYARKNEKNNPGLSTTFEWIQ